MLNQPTINYSNQMGNNNQDDPCTNLHENLKSGSLLISSSCPSLSFPDNNKEASPMSETPSSTDICPPSDMKKSLSFNTLNARAQSFMPRSGSASSLSGMKKAVPPPLVLPNRTGGSASSPHSGKKAAPPPLVLPPRSPITVGSSVLPPRSPITVAATTTTQKTSFVIPHPPGPPTLLHVFTTTTSLPSPTSPGPGGMFAPPLSPGHFSPRPSGMFVPPLSPGHISPRIGGMFAPPLSPGHCSPRPGGMFAPPLSPGHYAPAPANMFAPPLSPVGYSHHDLLAVVSALSPRPMSPAVMAALSMPPQLDIAKESMAGRKTRLLDEVSKKVLHQVEYYFSDLNVATTDHLIKYMTKDPEGYVPLSVVASFKKIRTTTSSNAQLANILRNSDKLIVSEDGKKVKRVTHLSEAYMEELQSRIVVAENLPDDHCHQNLMRIFSAVGSVKAIRTCQPSPANSTLSSASRAANSGLSNKLHAFVEYESHDLAEKAVVELSDKKNWRNGLKVRSLVKPQVKSSLAKPLKSIHDNGSDGVSPAESEQGDDDNEMKKPRGRGWGKGRVQYQPPNTRTSIMGCPPNVHSKDEQHAPIKQARVPRMPDGTRGFTMGRGKPIATRTA